MQVSEAKKLRGLEAENRKLKHRQAEAVEDATLIWLDWFNHRRLLSWEDHFLGNALDESRWIIATGQAPGFIPDNHVGYYLAENVKVENEYLRLRLTQTKEPDEGGNLWVVSSGALIYTKEIYGYGTYEWRMRMSSTADTLDGSGSPTTGSVSAGFVYVNNSETEIDFEPELVFWPSDS